MAPLLPIVQISGYGPTDTHYFDASNRSQIAKEKVITLLPSLGGTALSNDRLWVLEPSNVPSTLLVSSKPLEEPVAWYGPIVMNTQQELQDAFEELERGTWERGTFLKPRQG